jgi:hypothetical protein
MSTGRLGAGDTAIQPTILNAKGDLIAATAADTPAALTVGAMEQFLQPRAVRQQGYNGLRLLLVGCACCSNYWLRAKAAAEAKLAALGLTADDLKALGLGGN